MLALDQWKHNVMEVLAAKLGGSFSWDSELQMRLLSAISYTLGAENATFAPPGEHPALSVDHANGKLTVSMGEDGEQSKLFSESFSIDMAPLQLAPLQKMLAECSAIAASAERMQEFRREQAEKKSRAA